MREFKGDWKDLFNGFTLALDLRKMFLGFVGLLMTVVVCGGFTVLFARNLTSEPIPLPRNLAPHAILNAVRVAWDVIFAPGTNWLYGVIYLVVAVPVFLGIWALFGGAIARIAAYEIARDGERIEMRRALGFAWTKFSSFFMAPMICVLGFLFFFVCNLAGGALTKALDLIEIGGPLGALLLPLALLSGFIMMLIAIGAAVGSPLFFPAVAAEGTDSFDAMSRGFSYVYSRPWHFAWYEGVTAVYGWVCVTFVLCFTAAMCYLGVRACGAGFDCVGKLYRQEDAYGMKVGGDSTNEFKAKLQKEADEEKKDLGKKRRLGRQAELVGKKVRMGDSRLIQVNQRAFSMLLSRDHTDPRIYAWRPPALVQDLSPYARTCYLMNLAVSLRSCRQPPTAGIDLDLADRDPVHELNWGLATQITYWIVFAYLLIAMGMAWGYAVAYAVSQQTVIYFVLRKKVDGIEMNEVYEEPEDEGQLPEIKPAEAPKPDAPKPPDAK